MDILSQVTVSEQQKPLEAKRSSENFSIYGAEELENLLAHFLSDVSADEAWSEFAALKQIKVSSSSYASFSFQQFAESVLGDHGDVFAEMEKFFEIAVVNLIAVLSCEHGLCTNLMLISELGPP